MRLKYLVFTIIILAFNMNAQVKVRYWMSGDLGPYIDTAELDTGSFRNVGGNIFDFNTNPFVVSRKFKTISTSWNCVNMWKDDGNILFTSNGSKVFNSDHMLIENADSLNYSSFWQNTAEGGYYATYLIGSYPRSLMAFQSPSNPNQYYLVSTIMNYDSLAQTQWLRFHKVVYSIIDMSLNGGKGKMIAKEKLLLYGDFSHALSSCRHANGRDWWIVSRGYQDTNCYYFYKLDKDGIRYNHKQCIGINYRMKYIAGENDSLTLSYGSAFSPDGKKFAILSYKGLELFDFNRCTGKFSNFKFSSYPYGDTVANYTLFEGVGAPCFSPNSQLIYIEYARRLYQFDASSANFETSGIRVATYDGFEDKLNPNTGGFPTYFSTMQVAPNGKIYVGNGATARYMTEIEFPDKRGVACNVRQHAYRLPTYMGGVPYYPNYNLGADTCAGSAIAESETLDIKIYPNPASDFIYLISPSSTLLSFGEVGRGITLSNLLGQQTSPVVEVTNQGYRLDTRSFHEGIYILHIRDKNDNLVKIERIVIAR